MAPALLYGCVPDLSAERKLEDYEEGQDMKGKRNHRRLQGRNLKHQATWGITLALLALLAVAPVAERLGME